MMAHYKELFKSINFSHNLFINFSHNLFDFGNIVCGYDIFVGWNY